GSLTSEPGKGGGRSVEGNLTNTGTLAVNTNTEYNGAGATLTNEGTIVIANEKALTAPAADKVINAAAGNIEGLGSGKLSQRTGSFEQAAGKTTGTLPVVLDDLALSYAGTGASTIALRGTSTLSGRPSAGQTLSLQSTSSENTSVSAASFTNGGKLVLTNAADGDANSVALALAGGTLTNAKGAKLLVEHANGGSRTIEGSLVNEGTGAVTATAAGGQTLRVTGSFKQAGKKPILETTVAGASAFGALQVTGAATLAGELKLVQVKPFVPTVGEKFVILTGSAVSGTFKKVKGNKIKKAPAKLYAPIYGASSLTLEAQA
ncbi:MAG TPA: hypothetical protein VL979_14665, partial [Solirubrobacteraceae bacterium]|nr:hypothetical protein [Solirubrobacteraceae bacterium]